MREIVAIAFFVFLSAAALARDPEGSYERMNPALHAWFNSLSSSKGMCCSFADGRSVAIDDWGTQNKKDSHYWVKIDGQKLEVPDDAVITGPNRFGPAVVWPYLSATPDRLILIRCFLPGAES